MVYPELKEPVRFFKEEEGGHEDMCDVWKEIRQEGIEQGIEQGLEQGLKQGLEQGLEQGEKKERVKNALMLLRKKTDLGLIQEICGFDIDHLKALARENYIDYPF